MATDPDRGTIVLRHISGAHRGRADILERKTVYLLRDSEGDVQVVPSDGVAADQAAAVLHRAGPGYELEVPDATRVWINGQRVSGNRLLESGDLIEVGDRGPVLRFRRLPPGVAPKKTLAEAFADSIDGARANGDTRIRTMGRFFAAFAHDLATQTTLWFRVWMVVLVSVLVASVVVLVVQNVRLQKRISSEAVRIDNIATALRESAATFTKEKDLLDLREKMESRLRSLEARPGAFARVFEAVQGSVAFVQGAFGFVEPESGRPLRYIETPEGIYLFTLDERAKEVELPFTGTAFLVSTDGLLLTNKHVAEPWLLDERIEVPEEHGLKPAIRRSQVFLPGAAEPMDAEHLLSSEDADLALLRVRDGLQGAVALRLQTTPPIPGDEVLVVGYPLGIKGMLARATSDVVQQIMPEDVDFWDAARKLAAAGYIRPLASRGIASQLSDQYLVYDAETTTGGSGGPVLNLDGEVVAVNTAIVTGFGGSNLGVLAVYAEKLLQVAPRSE